jgi:hypothetical protein
MARLLSRLRDFGITGLPTSLLTWSQRVCEQIEAAFDNQQDQITAIADLQAQQTAQLAQILAAQATADTAKKNDKISASATVPSLVVSASDAGTDATITINGHTRQYGDGTSLAVSGGSITGLAYSTEYAVYYDDPTTANATPTYQATTTLKDAQPNAADGRHYVDQVTTPPSGGGSTSGGGIKPPGGGGPYA